MLFDARKEIHSLSGLIAWLETQPPEQTYDFVDNKDCLLCRYFRAHGIDIFTLCPLFYWVKDANGPFGISDMIEYPMEMNRAANGGFMADTYGNALKRAKELRGY